MTLKTKEEFDFIKMVANRLVEKLIWFLFPLNSEKNYAAHIGGLAEILEWSEEFYSKYYDKILNWETFKRSSENIYNAVTPDDLIITFGQERLKKFYTQNTNHTTYFLEKYSKIMNENYNTNLTIWYNQEEERHIMELISN